MDGLYPPKLPQTVNIRGVGIDIEDVERIRHAVQAYGDQFTNRILTAAEQRACLDRPDWAQRVSARWCAKEAIAKALGSKMSWTDVEILNHPSGAPYVCLHGRAALITDATKVFISLTHTKTQAAAIAIWVV